MGIQGIWAQGDAGAMGGRGEGGKGGLSEGVMERRKNPKKEIYILFNS